LLIGRKVESEVDLPARRNRPDDRCANDPQDATVVGMFVSLRDLRHARGRFALVGSAILLIAFLVTFLGALTAGLARESTSAVTDLPADYLAFAMPSRGQAPGFTASSVDAGQWARWEQVPGVESAQPIGVTTTRATSSTTTTAVTALGVLPGSALVPSTREAVPIAADGVVLSAPAATALSVAAGDRITLGGTSLTVTGVADVDASFAHTPALWIGLDTWRDLTSLTGQDTATVIAINGPGLSADAVAAADASIGTTTVSTSQARSAVSSFTSENSSLSIMLAFLIGISALVVGAFFTVWTISRSGDLAVLRAMGASTGYLLRDSLGQAVVVLLVGIGLGTVLATIAAAALASVVPVVVDPSTVLGPAVALLLAGLLGAGSAVVRVGRVDPQSALTSSR
jgi:putative ABC transport system permease protein